MRALQVQQRSVEAHRDGRLRARSPASTPATRPGPRSTRRSITRSIWSTSTSGRRPSRVRSVRRAARRPHTRTSSSAADGCPARSGRAPVDGPSPLAWRCAPLPARRPPIRSPGSTITVDNQTLLGRRRRLPATTVPAAFPGGRSRAGGGRRRPVHLFARSSPVRRAERWSRARKEGTFPVLVGEGGDTDVVLASPIILYDHPGGGPRERGRHVRRHRDRRDPRPAGPDPDRRRKARGPGHRSPVGRRHGPHATPWSPASFEALHGTFRSIRSVGLGPAG